MPRPCKKRFVCGFPKHTVFVSPMVKNPDEVVMTVDEYEIIRLMDLENYTQEQCAIQMQVARTTVQSIYTIARKKIAETLVHGKKLIIEGGNYCICSGRSLVCQQSEMKCCCKVERED